MEPWILSFTGRQVWPLDPRPEMICVEDVAHHLSLQTRFSGATPYPYSVAQHSLLVAAIVEREIARPVRVYEGEYPLGVEKRALPLAALLHDAPEYALVDLPSPLKYAQGGFGEGYLAAEMRLARAVERRFELPAGILDHPVIQRADARALVTEARDMGLDGVRHRAGRETIEPWPLPTRACEGLWASGEVDRGTLLVPVREVSWRIVEREFLEAFNRLGGKR